MNPSLAIDSATNILSGAEDRSTRLQILDPLAVPNWDALISALPGSSFFHSAGWARVLEETYHYKPLYFAQIADGKLQALLAVMEVESWLTGKRGVSLPFSDGCELLALEDAGAKAVLSEARRYGTEAHWKYLEVRSDRIPEAAKQSVIFLSHTLELSREEERIFGGFESSVRRAIRRAEKAGVTVEISRSLEAVKKFYALHCKTRQKHGVPPQSFAFFASFQRHILAHNLGFVAVASLKGEPVAANVFVHFGNDAVYKYGASDEKYQNFRGANLAMWHGIAWYARAGYERVHFGRTARWNEGLRRFKLGWGAQEASTGYFKCDLKAKRYVSSKEESFGWSNRIISRIPIPVAKVIGRVLYPHVA